MSAANHSFPKYYGNPGQDIHISDEREYSWSNTNTHMGKALWWGQCPLRLPHYPVGAMSPTLECQVASWSCSGSEALMFTKSYILLKACQSVLLAFVATYQVHWMHTAGFVCLWKDRRGRGPSIHNNVHEETSFRSLQCLALEKVSSRLFFCSTN